MTPKFRFFNGTEDWAWMNSKIPVLRVEDTMGLVAENPDTREPMAMTVFDNWTNNTVQAHLVVADKVVLRHDFIQLCLDYAFNARGVKSIYGMVPGNNAKALKLNKHIGFREVLRMKDGFRDGEDYVVMQLDRGDSRYVPEQLAQAG